MKDLLTDNPDATLVTLGGLNHLMQPATTGGLNEYAQIEPAVTPEVPEMVTSLLKECFVE